MIKALLKTALITISIVSLSCTRITGELTYDYPIKHSSERALRLDGYYYSEEVKISSEYNKDRKTHESGLYHFIYPMMFFSDGTCFYKPTGIKGQRLIDTNGIDKQICHYRFENYLYDNYSKPHSAKKDLRYWGTYLIKEDTCFIEVYDREWYAVAWSSSKFTPKIKRMVLIINENEVHSHNMRLDSTYSTESEIFKFYNDDYKPDSIWYFNKPSRIRKNAN